MLSTYTFYLSLFAIIASPVMAASASATINPLDNIRCHCLTFYTYSSPAACAYPHSQNITWSAAQTLASSHHLDITFTGPSTVSRVLKVEQPLPTSVLMGMYGARGRARQRHEGGSHIVCGTDDEVRRKYLGGADGRAKQAISVEARRCDGLVSEIVGIFVLMLVIYAFGDYLWLRFKNAGKGRIQLDGGEKGLLAHAEDGLTRTSPTSATTQTPQLSEKDGSDVS